MWFTKKKVPQSTWNDAFWENDALDLFDDLRNLFYIKLRENTIKITQNASRINRTKEDVLKAATLSIKELQAYIDYGYPKY